MRKGLTKKQAKNFINKPVAKKKADDKIGDAYTEKLSKIKRASTEYVDHKSISGGVLRGITEETMARVYSEMWPSMQTHDQDGKVDKQIAEEAYILGLTMQFGNGEYSPRRGLKIRDHKMREPKMCAMHRD
jgi:hypothetical protein